MTERRRRVIGVTASLLLLVGGLGAHACQTTLEAWAPALTVATRGRPKVHDLLEWQTLLWIAQGSGPSGTGRAVIRAYDDATGALMTAFEVPADTYGGAPYWRALRVFNGALYAGLGNNRDVAGTGDVYRFDGASWARVLDTDESDVYSLEVYGGQLYAGAGTDGLGAGKLYASPDGTTWDLVRTFSSDHVRALQVWQERLYIGLKQRGRLWSTDGTTFVDHRGTVQLPTQVKTLVPYGDRLYVGGVPAKIYAWDGQAFTLALDARETDSEIYKGAVYAGCLFFPTNARGVGGRVYKFDGATWTLDYVDAETSAQFQVVAPYAGALWLGGGARRGWPLTLRATRQSPD
jgi:hypothetical protein